MSGYRPVLRLPCNIVSFKDFFIPTHNLCLEYFTVVKFFGYICNSCIRKSWLMTIIQLEYLLAVANHGSFSQAAEKCFVTQPSLSMQVKNLEEELGVILLDRSKKPVIPTEAGTLVLNQAREAVMAFRRVTEAVNDLKGEVSGLLRLGVTRKYPKVELQIKEMVTADIVAALNRDMLDAAILAGGTSPGEIIEEELFDDRFYAYVSPMHPLYERSNIRIEDIDVKHLLLLSEGNCLRDQVLELCQARRRVPAQYAFESGSLDTLMRIVDNTANMTIIPELALDFIPKEKHSQIKTLAKGATSRKITIAVRRTYVKRSLISALKESIIGASK